MGIYYQHVYKVMLTAQDMEYIRPHGEWVDLDVYGGEGKRVVQTTDKGALLKALEAWYESIDQETMTRTELDKAIRIPALLDALRHSEGATFGLEESTMLARGWAKWSTFEWDVAKLSGYNPDYEAGMLTYPEDYSKALLQFLWNAEGKEADFLPYLQGYPTVEDGMEYVKAKLGSLRSGLCLALAEEREFYAA